MVHNGKKARRLVVGEETYLWSLGHEHHAEQGRYRDCREILTLRRWGARGRLLIVFEQKAGNLVSDGYLLSSGAAVSAGELRPNLHEPGTVRALLDAAIAGGWAADDPAALHLDGWVLADSVARFKKA